MWQKILLLLFSLSLSITINAQISGGQIRRQASKKVDQKQVSKKPSVKSKIRRKSSSSTKKNEDEELQILEIIPITEATMDGKDVSKEIIESQISTHIYMIGNDLYMMNYSERDDTNSWGTLSIVDSKEEPETPTQYRSITLQCLWQYQNDYDNKKGVAPVTIQMVNKTGGWDYTITIKVEQLTVYRGFVKAEN